jgi:hypothetical protein
MANNIAKHGPKVIDITERRREAIELDRFIAERGGLRLVRRRSTWLSTPTAEDSASVSPTDDDLAPFR